ncbi:MAG: RHS repeat protein, partial [bacterium]|nr:RHS repeat protein [bacterium]
HADGTVTEYGYGCDGSLEKEWDANHPSNNQENPATKVYEYDELGRLESVTQPWGGEGGGTVVVRYEYDVQDHLVKVVDGNGTVTTYEYSDRDLLTMEISEVTGVTTYAYDELGQVIRETDARDVTVKRQYDILGRLRFVDYPERDLDTMYDWDDKAVPFSKGRMTAIRRDGESVDYRYDRFGRMTQDGALTYGYDKNSNRKTIGYPGGVTATYTYDYADRQATLTFQDGEQPPQILVPSASYKPFGPLTSMTLGNGLTETRTYTSRYFPWTIEVPDRLSWTYETDAMGNVRAVTDHLDPASSRVFGYQDFQYHLTGGAGPWGNLSWTYDKIGNRLTEIRDGATTSYVYRQNTAGINSAQLIRLIVQEEEGLSRFYYDSAGNLTNHAAARSRTRFDYNQAKRLSQIRSETAGHSSKLTELQYDGRGYLTSSMLRNEAEQLPSVTRPTYSSEGVPYVFYRQRHPKAHSARSSTSASSTEYIFYFDSRLVAELSKTSANPPPAAAAPFVELIFTLVDHLGTPALATGETGDPTWSAKLEPFGAALDSGEQRGVLWRFRDTSDSGKLFGARRGGKGVCCPELAVEHQRQ